MAMRRILTTVALVALFAASTACASKKYVNTRVGDVNDKVTSLSQDLEKTQERTRDNEKRIGEVDAKAAAAGQRADAAGKSAADAMSAANSTDQRLTAFDQATKRLVFEVVLSEDKARFANGKATLQPEATVEIDKLVTQLAANPQNYYLEIEGHTDSRGSLESNERLGLKRAEAVKRYLYEQHKVPLHKMNVISFGETKPAAPNTTRASRAQNRRVVIKVLT
jgi:outer membrane protein OmpA-like peptidoglycan-associated protein